jgi:hypothetical protein
VEPAGGPQWDCECGSFLLFFLKLSLYVVVSLTFLLIALCLARVCF